jgi:probable rRNA maturation factor
MAVVEVGIELGERTLGRLGGGERVEAVARRAAEACAAVLQEEGAGDAELVLTFVAGPRMRALNRAYRGRDRATDVLSFSQREGEALAGPPEGDAALGDVVVALTVARRQARTFGHSLTREAAFLAVHGTLHLLGYDHETPAEEAVMMGKAERALGALGLGRDA